MSVCWFEQSRTNVSAQDDWLGPGERTFCLGLRFPGRRSDWRLGRWTAKQAVARYLGVSCDAATLASIRIQAAASGAPEAFFSEAPAQVSISLSHRDGISACAVGPAEMNLGCDLETIEDRSDVFVQDYFTPQEQKLVSQAPAQARAAMIALIWSAKESVLKVLRLGLRMSTQQLSVSLRAKHLASFRDDAIKASPQLLPATVIEESWFPFSVVCEGRTFSGRWTRGPRLVRTLAASTAQFLLP